jgi:excinuclease ABC subunit B
VLVTTLTKKMAEDLTDYLQEVGIQRPLHPLGHRDDRARRHHPRPPEGRVRRAGRHQSPARGLDLPEVSLVAILDADKEGYLRSERSLIQTIGRAARNLNGTVLMYADAITDSMKKAIDETNRRRARPAGVQPGARHHAADHPEGDRRAARRRLRGRLPDGPARAGIADGDEARLPPVELGARIAACRKDMREAAKQLDFERAAEIRDRIRALETALLGVDAAQLD